GQPADRSEDGGGSDRGGARDAPARLPEAGSGSGGKGEDQWLRTPLYGTVSLKRPSWPRSTTASTAVWPPSSACSGRCSLPRWIRPSSVPPFPVSWASSTAPTVTPGW